uniref:Bifunctional aspartokinase/homoserine dehydrogenase 1, chloroplastic n=1 Tax=Stylophora pistillata TaxID=50429 RepID=A0A2B4RFG1_STYPI
MIVEVFGIETFLPGSQIDVKPIRDYDDYVNKTMEFKIIKINHKFKNVVISHKALIEEDLAEQKKEIMSGLEKGQVLEGTVKNIASYGVFVDLGGVDGLIHITDLSWSRVSHPSEILELDQQINVVILDFDDEKTRIQLGIKQLKPHPWESIEASVKEGDKIKGKVSVVADYGAFVEVAPGVEGLIHVSEMSWSTHLLSSHKFLKVGEEVEAVVVNFNIDERKMSLSLKQLKKDPWTDITEKYPVGSEHEGIIRNYTNFGVFVELEEGIEGLIYLSDLSWTKKIKHPSEFLKSKDKIKVKVMELNTEIRKLNLSHKHTMENPWEKYESIYSVGSNHKGTIKTIKDKGAIVLISNEENEVVEAFLPRRHMEKEDGSTLKKARDKTTDQLKELLEKAKQQRNYKTELEAFKKYQKAPMPEINFEAEFSLLSKVLEGVYLLEDYSDKIKDLVLAQGELLSAKMVVALLNKRGIACDFRDSRKYLITDDHFTDAAIVEELSRQNIHELLKNIPQNKVQIFTGFIGANTSGETTTLGENGSNYSASLLASYIGAEILENYTHVDGIYTADPDTVSNTQKIESLSFKQALELAHFGTEVINAKAMIPLINNNIPLKIINTFAPNDKGTLICKNPSQKKGIQILSVLDKMALIHMDGKGLLNKSGIDARIFNALGKEQISVSIISQGVSERGISFLVKNTQANKAQAALANEFNLDFLSNDVGKIAIEKNVSVLSVLGDTRETFSKAYKALIRNHIDPILINNTVNSNNVSLILKEQETNKAVNAVHSEIFGVVKTINIAVFGVGNVGSTLIYQILENNEEIKNRKNIVINVFAVANSQKIYLNKLGIDENWETALKEKGIAYKIKNLIDFVKQQHLENLIAIDNTASESFTNNYETLIKNGFDLVSSNKIANTKSYENYTSLRKTLKQQHKKYLYETNVGAGLPLIETIALLHDCGENITRIRGVFSGTLSFLFNEFSSSDKCFSNILEEAIAASFTEPDPREDLNGNDVARKLLILARELDLQNEFSDIKIHNLIPTHLRKGNKQHFLKNIKDLDPVFEKEKNAHPTENVLRYIGDLHGDLQSDKGILEVSLVSIEPSSALAKVTGADAIFEIYTESYGEKPIVIQGAGAGAKVTARGVFGDILKLS